MFRIVKYLVVLLVLALMALGAFAYLGNYAPRPQPVDQPVTLTPQ